MISYAPITNPNYLEEHSGNEYFNEGDSEKGKFYGLMSIRDGSYGKTTDKESFYKLIGYNKDKAKDDFKTNALELTPSCPKYWSIIENRATPEERIKLDAIYEDAIADTVEAIQNNTFYRKTEKGKTKYVRAEGIKVAVYHHHTARAVADTPDCQKHSHIVIGNKCLGKDGKFYKHTLKDLINEKGSDETKLQETLHYFDQIFQSKLAKGLQRDLKLQIENDGKDNFKINGITDEMIKAFSQRSEDINKAAGENASSYAKQKVALSRRNSKVDYDLNGLREIWQEKMSSFGLERISDLPQGQIEQARDFKEVFKDVRFINEKLLKIYALSESKYSLKSSDEILKEYKESGNLKEFSKGKYVNLNFESGKDFSNKFERGMIDKISQSPKSKIDKKNNKNLGKQTAEARLQELEAEHQARIIELSQSKNSLSQLSKEQASYEERKNTLINEIAKEANEIDFEM